MSKSTKRCLTCGKYFKIVDKNKDLYCPNCREIELAKDNERMFETLKQDDTPVYNLIFGIINNASKEYISEIKKWHNANIEKAKLNAYANIRSFSRWFKSDDFDLFSIGLDGRKLQYDLNRKAFAEIREKRLKDKKKMMKKKGNKNNIR